MAIFPQLPAFHANNFIDHFPGSSLDARWTGVSSGGGVNTVTDSYYEAAAAVDGRIAFAYYGTKLDKSKNQLWQICFNRHAVGTFHGNAIYIVNKSTAPAADTNTNILAITTHRFRFGNVGSVFSLIFDYWDSGGTRYAWNTGGSNWLSDASAPAFLSPARGDDYYIGGIEFDAANSRWRAMGWCKTYSSGYTFDQGLRMFALTDWVTWTNTRTSSDLWLVIGGGITNDIANGTQRVEWVRYAEHSAPLDAWVNQKSAASGQYNIRRHYTFDGKVFVPQDRATIAIPYAGGGAWDATNVKDPWCVKDGSTYWMFYTGMNTNFQIGVASASSPSGTWTKSGSNPIIARSAGHLSDLGFPCVIKDESEPNANKRWKMLFGSFSSTDSKFRTYYSDAPAPEGAWSAPTLVLGPGGGGDIDENGCYNPTILWYGGQWEVWYSCYNASNQIQVARATGASLDALTKDGAGARLTWQANGDSSLTANLTGRTVTVSDTTGFTVDAPVAFDQDSNNDNWSMSRVRKVLSSTQLELYHSLDGFTTTTPAKAVQIDRAHYMYTRYVVQVGSEWWIYGIAFNISNHNGGSYGMFSENTTLWTHANASPAGATPAMDLVGAPNVSRGYNNDLRSAENITLVTTPFRRGSFTIPQRKQQVWRARS